MFPPVLTAWVGAPRVVTPGSPWAAPGLPHRTAFLARTEESGGPCPTWLPVHSSAATSGPSSPTTAEAHGPHAGPLRRRGRRLNQRRPTRRLPTPASPPSPTGPAPPRATDEWRSVLPGRPSASLCPTRPRFRSAIPPPRSHLAAKPPFYSATHPRPLCLKETKKCPTSLFSGPTPAVTGPTRRPTHPHRLGQHVLRAPRPI